jgi:hypothetical protein
LKDLLDNGRVKVSHRTFFLPDKLFYKPGSDQALDDSALRHLEQGCHIFLSSRFQNGKNVPNDHKIYKIPTKYTKWSQKRPNGHKIYQHLSLKDPPKFTQIRIFGLKIFHLATLEQIAAC